MRQTRWLPLPLAIAVAASLVGALVAIAPAGAQGTPGGDQPGQVDPGIPPGIMPPGVIPPGMIPPGIIPPGVPNPSDLPSGIRFIDNPDRPTHPPIAGLGDSDAAPSGTPMKLSLRPGWTLTEVRGGASDELMMRCMMAEPGQRPPECAFDVGMFQVTLRFQRTASAGADGVFMAALGQDEPPEPLAPLEPEPPLAPLEPEPPLAPLVPEPQEPLAPLQPMDACAAAPQWSGWVLTSDGGQNVWVPVWTCLTSDGSYTILKDTPRSASATPVFASLRMVASDTYELMLSGFCLNASRHAPGENDTYGLGVLSDDPGLAKMLDAVKGKQFSTITDRMAFQEYLWAYTEGQDLTDADWAAIRALK